VGNSQLVQTPVGVEKLFSRDFTNEIRSQVIESSFAAGAEIHTNYCFGSFFNSHAWFQQLTVRLAQGRFMKIAELKGRIGRLPLSITKRGMR
jgi:hypothetical protein